MTMPDVTRFFHPIMPSAALGTGPVGVTLAGRKYAFFRDRSGRAACLADACPHRRAPLSRGRVRPDGRLACPYHGWSFDADGCGASPSQPDLTRCDSEAFQVIERHGYLWMAARRTPLTSFPELDYRAEGYQFIGGFGTRFQAPLHVALDNFSENEHTPWVHTFLGWSEGDLAPRLRQAAPAALRRLGALLGGWLRDRKPEGDPRGEVSLAFEAHNFDDRTEVRYRAPQRRSPWLPLLFARNGDEFHNQWVTTFEPVRSVYSLCWSDPVTGEVRPVAARFAIYFVPETESTTWLHAFAFVRVTDRRLERLLMPVIRRVVVKLGRDEIEDDARFVPLVADTPFELKGMRLGKYDKPIVRNHKLLERIYLGRKGLDVLEGDAQAPAPAPAATPASASASASAPLDRSATR